MMTTTIFRSICVISLVCILGFLVPARVLAQSFNNFDGGKLGSRDTECTCSGGETIKVNSYVDNSEHTYLYEYGATQLDQNYNIESSGNYFLTTLVNVPICLVYKGEECDSSDSSPEGMFLEIGTSFKYDKQSMMALVQRLPGVSAVSKTISRITPDLSWSWNGSNL